MTTQQFEPQLKYITGTSNTFENAMSRLENVDGVTTKLALTIHIVDLDLRKVKDEQKKD